MFGKGGTGAFYGLDRISVSMVAAEEHRRLRIARILAIILATAIACILVLYLSIPMSVTQQRQFDVILVLGNPAKDDGSIGQVARSRVLEAVQQYRDGVAPHLLMTGGAVQNRFVEAEVMRQFALSQGVPAAAVFTEDQSRNTIQNAYYSYKIMQDHDWTSALVVSSPSHLRRASLIFLHFPLAWRMHEAPWPPGFPRWKIIWYWCSESGYTSYARIFGFPNAKQFLPRTQYSLPKL
jgi:uncharacterized SAM-binding protein YcdF (DUF218 family)